MLMKYREYKLFTLLSVKQMLKYKPDNKQKCQNKIEKMSK